jgi:hypothetical protein
MATVSISDTSKVATADHHRIDVASFVRRSPGARDREQVCAARRVSGPRILPVGPSGSPIASLE